MEEPAIRRGGAEDLISRLPDELLHTILVRLPSAADAARTSVLSRRWRGVWAHMPELVLCGSPDPATPSSAVVDSIDAALNSYAAPTLASLKIDVSGVDRCDVPAHRVFQWLRFASQRVAGKLRLRIDLKVGARRCYREKEELALPICERVTEIDLNFPRGFFIRPPPTGSFLALTDLIISCGKMDGSELGRAVSSLQCPRLRKLYIDVWNLVLVFDVSIYSESLECLKYYAMDTGKLEVNAPMLQEITVGRVAEACIIAPKLEKVVWSGGYNPGLHHFAVTGRHLQSLYVFHKNLLGMLRSSTQLMKRFDSAKELIVSLSLYQGLAEYVTFLTETDKLPTCESLIILLVVNDHALAAVMFHLLRSCSCIRKLKLFLISEFSPPEKTSCSVSDCPCLLPDNYRLDGITFDSLEEIEIEFFTGSDEQEQFMKLLLSKCNTVTLKRVDIMVPHGPVSSEVMEAIERIRSVCHPYSKTQFNVHTRVAVKPLAS